MPYPRLPVHPCTSLLAGAVALQALACTEPPPAVATAPQALVDTNGIDWNGIDWNGIDWNGIDWNGIDWNGVELLGLLDPTRGVHPDARPLFVFVRARAGAAEFPLAVPSPAAQRMIDRAPSPGAAIHFLVKSWEIAYGPGFRFYAGRFDADDDGVAEPIVAEGRYGLAPSLAGLGPYVESQVMAWSSVIGNLLNTQPFQLSLRAYGVTAMAAEPEERARYSLVDLRGAIGRLIPPPGDPEQRAFLVLFRDRINAVSIGIGGDHLVDQLDQRRACPLDGAPWVRCYGGDVTVVDLRLASGAGVAGCTAAELDGPYQATVPGTCWVDLPHVRFTQDAASAPITASLVDMRVACPGCSTPLDAP